MDTKLNWHKDADFTSQLKQYQGLTEQQLVAEKQKLEKKENVNYICVGNGYFNVVTKNIANYPTQKNRVFVRKKIAFISAMISGFLKGKVDNYAPFWKYINNSFLNTIAVPEYATATLQNKKIAFADKLSLDGMMAYRKYLMFVYDNLSGGMSFEGAVNKAIRQEFSIDNNLNRGGFFTRNFLPKSIDAIYNNLLKERAIDEVLKHFGLKEEKTNEK